MLCTIAKTLDCRPEAEAAAAEVVVVVMADVRVDDGFPSCLPRE